MTRRYRWTPDQIDALPDGYAEDQVLKHAAWDEAVEWVRKRHARKNAPRPDHGRGRRPIFGMPGQVAPERRGDDPG